MEGYLAEIRMFAGNFAPRGWFFCQGQLLSISQWTALFALLGTTYGGNGQTTFGLPDFRGRCGDGTGTGPGLPSVDLGEIAGTPSQTLILTNLPIHNHTATFTSTSSLNAATVDATLQNPGGTGAVLATAKDTSGRPTLATPAIYAPSGTATPAALAGLNVSGGTVTTGLTGGNQPFDNTQPYLGMNFIICAEGIFPSRN